MFGNQLFWLDNCSDEFLLEVYKEATGLLVSSLAEGYSLPIVESQILECLFLQETYLCFGRLATFTKTSLFMKDMNLGILPGSF